MKPLKHLFPGRVGHTASGLLRAILLITVCGTIAACKKEQPKQAPKPPAEVEVYTTRALDIPVVYKYIGQTEANQDVEVRARVQGVIWDQQFQEGTLVQEGQFLFLIDPRPFQADTQIAEAQAYQAQVAVDAAKRDLERTQRLQSSQSVSREELDNALSAYETAVASLRLSEASVMKTRLELSFTTVTAPVTGLVGRALKRKGDLVDTTANSLLCTISAQDPMFMTFTASEKDMLRYKSDVSAARIVPPENEDYSVELVLLDGSVYEHAGRINYSDVKIDPQTGTGEYRASFDNKDGVLKPGQFVVVNLRGATRKSTVVVPQKSVMQGMQGSYVYVVHDNKVEMRPVETSDWEGDNWIVERGLKEGENIILAGVNKTAPGAEVKVTTVTTTLDMPTSAGKTAAR